MKLEVIAEQIAKIGLVMAILIVGVLLIRAIIEEAVSNGFDFQSWIGTYISVFFKYIVLGITIIVMAIPEGLPLAVMISLAYSVKKMLQDQNFVKWLSSCEVMGAANIICSDKTGTLTQNKMEVVRINYGSDVSLKGNLLGMFDDYPHRELIYESICSNTYGLD